MESGAERTLAHLFREDRDHVLIGIAGMDHQGQSGLARRGDMGAEDLPLNVPWALVVMIVEAGLADSDAARVLRELDQLLGGHIRLIGGVVRMGTDSKENALVSLRERFIGLTARHMSR